MVTSELISYIKAELLSGKSKEEITYALTAEGWTNQDITQAFTAEETGIPTPGVQLASISTLFTAAWENYTKKLGLLLSIISIPILALIGITAAVIASAYMFKDLVYTLAVHISHYTISQTEIIFLIIAAFILLSYLYLYIWCQVSLVLAITDLQKQTTRHYYTQARPLIKNYFVVSFLYFCAIVGGLMLFIIPALIFGIWYNFAGIASILQNKKGVDALKFSKNLVVGRMDKLFLRIVVVNVGAYLLLNIFSKSAGIINPNAPMLFNALFNLVWWPLSICYHFELYKNALNSKPGSTAF